jgi:NAD(P)-dependent dehydrogenase (short-subunit alcohol dehydrogenase family)
MTSAFSPPAPNQPNETNTSSAGVCSQNPSMSEGAGLRGKLVLVAGGGGGIGSDVATLVAEMGASVVVSDYNLPAATAVAERLRESGAAAAAYALDITSDASVNALFERIQLDFGQVYGIVNCVGVVGVGSALECPLPEYQRQFEVNCLGAIRLARRFVAAVRSTASTSQSEAVTGSLVYISSIAAELAIPNRDPYCVSKAAGQLFHLNLANEVAREGINVNVVLPGRTDTPSAAERATSSPTVAAQMYATQRRPAMIPVRTIASTCAFLLSPQLVGCSGQKITIAEGADTTYRPSYEALQRAVDAATAR